MDNLGPAIGVAVISLSGIIVILAVAIITAIVF